MKHAENFDNVSEFVDENENALRNVVEDIIDEDCVKSRLTKDQEDILRLYYLENNSHEDIGKRMDMNVEKVMEKEDRAFQNIFIFSGICGVDNPLEEENLSEKLKNGQRAIEKRIEEMKKFFTKEEMDVIHKNFYVLNGIGEKNDLLENTKILRKAKRAFCSKYERPKI